MLAIARCESGKVEDADAALKALGDRFPAGKSLTATKLWLADKALSEERFDRAADLFRQVADSNDPKRAPARFSGLGLSLFKGKKPLEAADAFAKLVALAPDGPLAAEASLDRAQALEAGEKYEDALESYAATAKQYSRTDQAAPASLARARLLLRLKRPADAALAFEAFVGDDPKSEGLDVVLADWGWALLDAKNVEKADEVFNRLLEDFPKALAATRA